jgi:hypothetical protein
METKALRSLGDGRNSFRMQDEILEHHFHCRFIENKRQNVGRGAETLPVEVCSMLYFGANQ